MIFLLSLLWLDNHLILLNIIIIILTTILLLLANSLFVFKTAWPWFQSCTLLIDQIQKASLVALKFFCCLLLVSETFFFDWKLLGLLFLFVAEKCLLIGIQVPLWCRLLNVSWLLLSLVFCRHIRGDIFAFNVACFLLVWLLFMWCRRTRKSFDTAGLFFNMHLC